ncbi:30548_t:CDS:2, partial [Racocetra persica]
KGRSGPTCSHHYGWEWTLTPLYPTWVNSMTNVRNVKVTKAVSMKRLKVRTKKVGFQWEKGEKSRGLNQAKVEIISANNFELLANTGVWTRTGPHELT